MSHRWHPKSFGRVSAPPANHKSSRRERVSVTFNDQLYGKRTLIFTCLPDAARFVQRQRAISKVTQRIEEAGRVFTKNIPVLDLLGS